MTDQNEISLRSAIGNAIMGMKRQGTTGCSFDNLRQMTSFRSLTCTPAQLDEEFHCNARKVAGVLKFKLWEN